MKKEVVLGTLRPPRCGHMSFQFLEEMLGRTKAQLVFYWKKQAQKMYRVATYPRYHTR